MRWSRLGPAQVVSPPPFCSSGCPERNPAGPDPWAFGLPVLTSHPEITATSDFTGSSGASCGVSDQSAPVFGGIHRSGRMPLPQKKRPKRLGNAPLEAYARPLASKKASSGGSPIVTAAPPSSPRSTARRSIDARFIAAYRRGGTAG